MCFKMMYTFMLHFQVEIPQSFIWPHQWPRSATFLDTMTTLDLQLALISMLKPVLKLWIWKHETCSTHTPPKLPLLYYPHHPPMIPQRIIAIYKYCSGHKIRETAPPLSTTHWKQFFILSWPQSLTFVILNPDTDSIFYEQDCFWHVLLKSIHRGDRRLISDPNKNIISISRSGGIEINDDKILLQPGPLQLIVAAIENIIGSWAEWKSPYAT